MHQVNALLELLVSPLGIFGAGLLGAMVLVAARSPRWSFWFFAFPIFASTVGKYRYIKAEYVFPLNYMETYSRPLFALLLGTFLIIVYSNRQFRKAFRPSNTAWLLLLFQLHFSALMILNEIPNGLPSIPIFLLSFVVMTFLAEQLRDYRHRQYFIESVVLSGALFTFACVYQWLRAPQNSIWAGRFIGITDNSQHTAQFLALFIIPTVFLQFSNTKSAFQRNAIWGLLAVEVGLLFFTGSRTGLLMTLLPLAIMFRRRSRYIGFAAIGLGVVAAFAVLITPESQEATQRLVSTKDTRSELFISLWQQFLDNPMFGKMNVITYMGVPRVQIRENTYLMVASMMGMVGITIFGSYLFVLGSSMRRLLVLPVRSNTPQFHDFLLASLVSILAGAFFEGYLLAIVGPCYLLLYLYAHSAEAFATGNPSLPGAPVPPNSAHAAYST